MDDPISSFDTNKKYAIINRIFANDPKLKTLYKKTVLMLTHDFQPVVDFIVNAKPHAGATEAAFLSNCDGILLEEKIEDSDIRSFTKQLCESAVNDQLNKVHRIISLRKLIEHTERTNDQWLAYNLLSSLVHLKPNPTFKNDSPLGLHEIDVAESYIKEFISDFSYHLYIVGCFSKTELINTYINAQNDYFKIQVFRILIELFKLRSKIDDPMLKYIDEQFHVENDYVFYLDYTKYNTVPASIVPKCTEFLKKEGVI